MIFKYEINLELGVKLFLIILYYFTEHSLYIVHVFLRFFSFFGIET